MNTHDPFAHSAPAYAYPDPAVDLDQHYIEHVELTPWQRYWRAVGGGSLTFAILLHAAILLIGMFWIISTSVESVSAPDPDIIAKGGGGGKKGEVRNERQKRQRTMVTSSANKRVVTTGQADYTLADPGDLVGDMNALPSMVVGGGGGLGGPGSGGGWGSGEGPGWGPGKGWGGPNGKGVPIFIAGLPETIRHRCTQQERLKQLTSGGGGPECERSVVLALNWLRSKQNSDGSWGQAHKAAMTGLALLAFYGHCETPKSSDYGPTVTKGMTYLINLAGSSGAIKTADGNAWVYEHAIATYALCEALTFCKELDVEIPGLQETCRKAVDVILRGQNPSGFWDYGYNTTSSRPGDTSVTGWHVQALKAAWHAGFKSPEMEKAIGNALRMMESVQADDGTFGYTTKESRGQNLVGVGALCFQMWGKGNARPAREAVRWMNRNLQPVWASGDANLYAWYYATLALFQRGGSVWAKWNAKWKPEMLSNQNPTGDWKPEGAFHNQGITSTKSAGEADADLYRTCLCTLMMEVYYRFLPGTGGGDGHIGGGSEIGGQDEFGP